MNLKKIINNKTPKHSVEFESIENKIDYSNTFVAKKSFFHHKKSLILIASLLSAVMIILVPIYFVNNGFQGGDNVVKFKLSYGKFVTNSSFDNNLLFFKAGSILEIKKGSSKDIDFHFFGDNSDYYLDFSESNINTDWTIESYQFNLSNIYFSIINGGIIYKCLLKNTDDSIDNIFLYFTDIESNLITTIVYLKK